MKLTRRIPALLSALCLMTAAAPAALAQSASVFTQHVTEQVTARLAGKTPSAALKLWVGTTNTRNPDAWTADLDLSGVSRNGLATLISPRHFIAASHVKPAAGAQLLFVGQDGLPCWRTVAGTRTVSGDLTVGAFTQDLPASVTFYPLMAAADRPAHIEAIAQFKSANLPLIVLDQEGKALVHHLSYFSGGNIQHRSPGTALAPWYEMLVSGDSGKPAFLVVNGGLVLQFCHHTALYGPDLGLSLSGITAKMQELDTAAGFTAAGAPACAPQLFDFSAFQSVP